MYFNYLYFNYFTTLLLKSRVSFIGVIYTVGISDGLASAGEDYDAVQSKRL